MTITKFIPGKPILQTLNEKAIECGYNQVIEPTAFDRIPEACYPITSTMLESDGIVRCRVVLNDKGDTVLLDMNMDVFNTLPECDTDKKKEGEE